MRTLPAALLTLLFLNCLASAEWTVQPIPVADDLYDVQFLTDQIGYATGWGASDGGVVLKTTDGGQSWSSTIPQDNTQFFDVDFDSPQVGRVTGYNGQADCAVVFTTTDGGASWTSSNLTESSIAYETTFPAQGIGYACGADGAIFNTFDGGSNWWTLPTFTAWTFRRIQAVNTVEVFALAGDEATNPTRLWRTPDGGEIWDVIHDFSPMMVNDIHMMSSQIGIVVGTVDGSEEIQRTTDGGNSWVTVHHSNSTGALHAVHFNGQDGLAAGDDGRIFRSHDGGLTWELDDTVGLATVFAVFQGPSLACVAGTAGGLYIDDTPLAPVTFSMAATGPTVFPAAGGTLNFNPHLVSTLPNAVPGLVFWTKVQLSNGQFLPQPIHYVPFQMAPFMDVTGTLSLTIPALAPASDYTLWGWVGFSPNGGPTLSDTIPFSKTAAGAGSREPGDWSGEASFSLNHGE